MDNNDLVWDLEKFRKQQRAKDLILGVENRLCVYSGSVQQLYTNYDVFFPKEENRKLVILPNPYAPHDTFHCVPEESVSATGLFLVGAEEGEPNHALKLIIPINRAQKKYRKVPLDIGIKLINSKRSKPFLPVVMKGDLREFNQETPCLHLRSIVVEKIKMLSDLEAKQISDVILDRLTLLTARSN